MSDFFALPPFKPAEALVQLRRQLRELRPLVERGDTFLWQGHEVLTLRTGDDVIEAHLAKRPARTPEWSSHPLKSSADVRRFVDTVKAQLNRWSDE